MRRRNLFLDFGSESRSPFRVKASRMKGEKSPADGFQRLLFRLCWWAFSLAWVCAGPAAEEPKTLAVLPFASPGVEEEVDFLACGIREEMLLQLRRLPELRVIGRESADRFESGGARDPRAIARALAATHILEGSVTRVAAKFRLELLLYDGSSGLPIWSVRNDWAERDLLRLQAEFSLSVAQQLKLRLTPDEKVALVDAPTKHRGAYELFLRADFAYRAGRVVERLAPPSRAYHLQTVELLERAVALDPHFYLAYCRLAQTHHLMFSDHFDRTPARLRLGEEALAKAASLRPEGGEVRLERARRLYRCLGEYRAAQTELAAARALLPNDTDVLVLTGQVERKLGLWEQAEKSLRLALDLNPYAVQIPRHLALLAEHVRKYDLAAEMRDRVIRVHPQNDFSRVLRARIEVYRRADVAPLLRELRPLLAARGVSRDIAGQALLAGLWADDRALAARALECLPPEGFFTTNLMAFPKAWCRLLWEQKWGDKEAVREAGLAAKRAFTELLAARPEEPTLHSLLGLTQAALGESEEAIARGRRAVELQARRTDYMDGPDPGTLLAVIYSATGDPERAVNELRQVVGQPNFLAHFGLLRLDPWWNRLRGRPDFELLVSSVAPPED